MKPAPDAVNASLCEGRNRGRNVRGIWLSIGLISWILLTEVAVASWYAPATEQKVTSAHWSVAWPTSERDYRSEPISATVETLLRYNEGGAGTWRSADGRRWMMYSFRWLPGRTAALFIKNHRPEICLPATGLTMEETSGVHLVVGQWDQPADSFLPLRRQRTTTSHFLLLLGWPFVLCQRCRRGGGRLDRARPPACGLAEETRARSAHA